MKILKLIILLFIIFAAQTDAKHLYPEKFYQNKWCSEQNGRQEVKLIDDTRIDCLTKDYAIEFDFAPKWAESIGQSLHYARMSGKKAGIVLIIENSEDFKYYNKIKPLCKDYDIALWYTETPKTFENDSDYNNDIVSIFISLVRDLFAWVLKQMAIA